MRRTMPSEAEAGRGADCPTGPKPADSGCRLRRVGGGGGEDDVSDPLSSLDTLVSGGVPYSSSPDDDAELDEAGGGGGSCACDVAAISSFLLDLVSIFLLIV